jgi:hypothetical protein
MKNYFSIFVISLVLFACNKNQPESAPALLSNPKQGFDKATSEPPITISEKLGEFHSCNIDSINDSVAKDSLLIPDKSKFKMAGWSANVTTGESPKDIFIEFDGPTKKYIKLLRGLKRPDVAASYKNPVLENSGWEVYVDLSDTQAGEYKMRIIQIEKDNVLICKPKRSIVLN